MTGNFVVVMVLHDVAEIKLLRYIVLFQVQPIHFDAKNALNLENDQFFKQLLLDFFYSFISVCGRFDG